MPGNNGFLSGYAGNFWQRLGRGVADGLLPGNQRASDGTLNNNVLPGIIARLGTIGASMFGGPMAGMAANKIAGSIVDSGFLGGDNFQMPQIGMGVQDLGFGSGFQPQVGGWSVGPMQQNLTAQNGLTDQQRQWALQKAFGSNASQQQAMKEAQAAQARDFLRGMTSPTATMDAARQQSLAATNKMFSNQRR